ncbi:N-acetylglucosamine-6-phosphate deacetylase [Saccharomonospora sp. CUA-673]|uniref:N-acetylglucosamine-6-phosphate deacetylase n=1 Tax=Saccharomonospora sp. CUA-673 TaxID=1904969 RepID=UPI0009649A04|nr:N-acetylglucosamine-6-phosphate deacetylase [Saccharomonospora sp. CUA-673]OLT38700.1 N-acetylglucosamine-6-phosphate deacetylase [Saccharomonospora sp. CUA-673]
MSTPHDTAPTAADLVLSGGRVALPSGVVDDGWVAVAGETIVAAGTATPPAGPRVDLGGQLVVPGFVDTHCHGGGGASFSTTDPTDAVRAVHAHRRHGTTTMLASLVSEPVPTLASQVAALAELVTDGLLAGIHLEGPFLAESRCGAHDPAVLREPDPGAVSTLLDAGPVRMVTLAPELPGGVKAVRQIAEAGVLAAVGHSDARRDDLRAALDAGATVATHLFNGMRPLHHREPGVVGTLLDDERVTVELISDLVHVHPDVLHLAATHAGRGRTTLITDAMAATGGPDGRYTLGALDVDVRGGVATLPGSGALAGSTLTMDAAFRNVVHSVGLDIDDAIHATSRRPAELLGVDDRVGRIEAGLRADLVVLDDQLRTRRVMHAGRWVTNE